MSDEAFRVIYSDLDPGSSPIKIWDSAVNIEDEALQQAKNLSRLPFIHKHVALMPDAHWGMGSTVGSVIATDKAVIPAAVGVDIGCGMMAQQLDLTAEDLPDSLAALRTAIEKAVPHGRTSDGGRGDRGAWGEVPYTVRHTWTTHLAKRFTFLAAKHPDIRRTRSNYEPWGHHFGTLGTGNHFIEVCLDENNNVWIMLHSGSRGIGNKIGRYFIQKAKDEMQRWLIQLDDVNLAYLPEGHELFDDYIQAVTWAQDYARHNRELMMTATLKAVTDTLGKELVLGEMAVNCHHNYVTREHHFGRNVLLTRKGAVCAREGTYGIIPGSMGAKSYIVRGKGSPQSFHSCSHGAGRAMSRTEAKRRFTVEDHVAATEGVECRKDEGVVDETPAAYKDIDAVMESQRDLVDTVHILKQILCVKG